MRSPKKSQAKVDSAKITVWPVKRELIRLYPGTQESDVF